MSIILQSILCWAVEPELVGIAPLWGEDRIGAALKIIFSFLLYTTGSKSQSWNELGQKMTLHSAAPILCLMSNLQRVFWAESNFNPEINNQDKEMRKCLGTFEAGLSFSQIKKP